MAYRKGARHGHSPVLELAERFYRPTLEFALRKPFQVLFLAFLSLGAALWALPRLGTEFLPELNEGSLYLTFTLPPNIGLSEGRRLVPRIWKLIASNPQVEATVSQLGRPEDGTDAKLPNNLEFFVKLKPAETWPKETRTLGDLIQALERSVKEVPGLEVNFSQPIRDNLNESISGKGGQIAVKLYGEDLAALQAQAEKVKRVISKVRGAADLAIVRSAQVPYVQIRPDRYALARNGLYLGEFQHVLQSALGGVPVGEYWDGERRFDIVMRFPLSARDDIEKIRKVRVPVPSGAIVPLEALARVETGFGRASINRENGRRYIGIRMNVRGRDLGGFVNE